MPHHTSSSGSGSESEDLDDLPFDVDDIDPYEILQLDRTADQKQIKKAYYGAAIKHHPDKVATNDKDAATERFQKVQFAYSVLSDERRKEKYDKTGSTKQATELDDKDFSWKDFFDGLNDKVDEDAIEQFKSEYKGSTDEKADLLAFYTQFEGNMDDIYEHVILSSILDDDERFRAIIGKAIDDGEISRFKAYTQETAASRKKRTRKARNEVKEAEALAKALKLPSSFFGGNDEDTHPKDSKKKRKAEDTLAMMIQQRQDNRKQNFFDSLEAKYTPKKTEKKKRKTQEVEEPPEEAFQRNAKT